MLRPYLEVSQSTIRTTHQRLRWMVDLMELMAKLARRRLKLAQFNSEVVYRLVRYQKVANTMSGKAQQASDKK